jgi:protein-tyrosine phosphatase
LKEEAADFEVKVERFNFPIPDFDVPSINLMKKILDTIDGQLERGHNVYVHCIGGIGRTGTTVACHLIRHGLTGEEAMAELQSLRQNTASWYRR